MFKVNDEYVFSCSELRDLEQTHNGRHLLSSGFSNGYSMESFTERYDVVKQLYKDLKLDYSCVDFSNILNEEFAKVIVEMMPIEKDKEGYYTDFIINDKWAINTYYLPEKVKDRISYIKYQLKGNDYDTVFSSKNNVRKDIRLTFYKQEIGDRNVAYNCSVMWECGDTKINFIVGELYNNRKAFDKDLFFEKVVNTLYNWNIKPIELKEYYDSKGYKDKELNRNTHINIKSPEEFKLEW